MDSNQTKARVQIFSTPTCHYCHMAKDFLKDKSIDFVDYNVGEDADRRNEMIEVTGQMGVPVIIVDGDKADFILGFDQSKLEAKLGLAA